MREYKIYLISVLFVCLTAVKLCFPSVPARLRQESADILCSGMEYSQAIQAMGRSLAHGQLDSQLVQVLEYISPDGSPRASGAIQAEERPDRSTLVENPDAQSAEEESSPLDDARLSEQKLPDRVSAALPHLPFEYTKPAIGTVSSGFGYREDPLDGEAAFHYGTDIAAHSGDSVLAFADGTVAAAGTDEGYGNYYIIDHPEGFSTLYAHLSEFVVREGQEVEKGQLIGYVGQSGKATGLHLHFELICQGNYLNPEYYI